MRKSKKQIKKILEENKKDISVRRVYQNAKEIVEDWLREIKYT